MRMIGRSTFALFVLAAGVCSQSTAQEYRITDFGSHFVPIDANLSKSRSRTDILGAPHDARPRYYRLRIQVTNPHQERWTIAIRSENGRIISEFDQSAVTCQSDAGCWTKRLTSELPIVQLSTHSDEIRAEIVEALYMPEEIENTYYSWIEGSEDKLLSNIQISNQDERNALQMLADNLGMYIGTGKGPEGTMRNWCCSGTRLTRDLFMTNWHCGAIKGMPDEAYWNGNSCSAAIVDMSWDGDEEGREYGCGAVEFQNKALDVAIIRLSELADGPALHRPIVLPQLSTEPAMDSQHVTVLHHPDCKAKSVTRGCTVIDSSIESWTAPADTLDKPEFAHGCTTASGSSGGPIFSSDAQLIGLHHLGKPELGDGNIAINISAILEMLKTANPELLDELNEETAF